MVGLGSILVGGSVVDSSAATTQRWRSVTFDGVRLSVPASWPVIDFARHPKACPRLDVHAVYLGRPGPNPICPAGLVGKTEAVMIGPLGKTAASQAAAGAGTGDSGRPLTRSAKALVVDKDWTVSRTITDDLPGAGRQGAQVSISYGTDRALALAIQSSIAVTETAPASRPTRPAPTQQARLLSAQAPQQSQGRQQGQGLFTGSGFDSCAAPSASAMTNWLASSYRAVGVYIGGANRACAQANLTPSWLTGIVAQGWHYFPLYPGLQSSCVQAPGDATITTSQASSEGKAAADDAVTQAASLGIPAGTPLIYDMEAYGPACNSQVTTFLSAWDSELTAKGYVSGVYESFTNIGALVAAADTMTEPQVIYYADWDDDATTSSSYMPSGMWTDHQRLHQYQGSHLETFGGTTIDIDSDRLDVNLGDGAPAPAPPPSPGPAGDGSLRISVAMNANGTAEWFAKSAGNTLTHSWQAPVGSLTWSAMRSVGRSPATIASNPTVAPQADGALTVIARSTSGRLVHAWQQAGFPNDWEWGKQLPALNAKIRSGTDPAAVLMPSGDVAVIQTENDGNLAVISQAEPNGNAQWTSWQDLSGQCASTPVPLLDANHDVDVFCRTTAGSAAVITWNGVSWGRWSPLAGGPVDLAGVPAAAVNGSGQTEFFAATTSGGLADAWQSGVGSGTWTWGLPLAGTSSKKAAGSTVSIAGSPAAADWPAGQVIVYARTLGNQLDYIRQDGPTGAATWGSWATIGGIPGGKMMGSPSGWLNTEGAASVAVIDHEHKLAVASDADAGWSAWSEVGSGF
jgi:hypothetical protein